MALTEDEKLILVAVLTAAMLFVIFFELRVMRNRSKEIRRKSQSKDEAFNAILTTRSVMGVMKRQGGDTGAAERLVSSAKRALDRGEYDKCMDLCEQARDELTNPSGPSKTNPSGAEPPPRGAVDEAERERLERVAENILSTRTASSGDSYKGTKLSSDQDGSYLSAKFELNTAKEDIRKAVDRGLDTSSAQNLMTDAEAAFTTGNYARALSLAVKVRKSVSSDATRETIRLKSAGEPAGPHSEAGSDEAPEARSVVCGKCEATIDSDDEFCPKCGTKVLKERMCPVCGSKPRASDMFCRKCGARLG